ncbi:MAG: ribosome recycling factor [Candidatus Colwellbacteria bacterium CG_4_9_14_0_2_um_filter_50_12]|uniref:Ribosome recycling factor n=1 Tax=Candidatus Colwellbacteria bacterium CG_4_9_14_0_2_um_filter_50_12 TaxID=1974538 RepID=A0A2M8G1G5_9BACT|nr:MAG: ribosome recycling factor [Candidatus Colwellbacteria bacterium CG_4_9_14_0_2_um_filter_50_12]
MDYLDKLETEFNRIAGALKEELTSFRTNRPSPKLIENIKVDFLGQSLIIKQLGSITIEPPRDLVISVWDKNALPAVVKAIESGNLGLGVSPQGATIRVRTPELTEERRRELEKLIRAAAESTRIKMRVERDAANKIINAEIDKDVKFRAKEKLQKLVDKFNEVVETALKDKLRDIAS